MLVLTRKKGESIMIGDTIEVVVLGSEGDAVKIGIKAPQQVQIYRSEIYEMIQVSNREATQSVGLVDKLSQWMKKPEKNGENDR
ncbi:MULTISPECIES: carbon storage regulator CsrA [Paenibacillus]|uniref:Translational regulator CsrA n=1 Tax=Paenibacillus oceani TaxID=2772510 RepID=A0A927C932_9BACL|nr:carbon storage regulator CsrA [Paenibacillus oceani]MBD2863638.1 carbon storage regulator CsrA [Paenibacillus oceani]MDF2662985.1 csrA [Paenibacillus sp.]